MLPMSSFSSFTKTLFECIMGLILEVAEDPLLIAGDFNTVLTNSLDRFGCSTQSTSLRSCLKKFDLVDAKDGNMCSIGNSPVTLKPIKLYH